MKRGIVLVIILNVIIFLIVIFYLFSYIGFGVYGTEPEKVLNYTKGKFTISPYSFISFEDFYRDVVPDENINYYYIRSNYTLEPVKLELNKFYEYKTDFYVVCQGKRVEINFTNPKYSEFNFKYKDMNFNYKINLYADLYYFSSNLKDQDCYFQIDGYPDGYFKDPYNNLFLDVLSNDFISLKEKGYTNNEIVEIATLFVQSIEYETDESNTNRYPYETFYEEKGNCLDKSLILVGILKNLGYSSYIILGDVEEGYHALVGIVCDKGNIQYEGKEICFIETTSYNPVNSNISIKIEKYIQTSNGSLIYEDVSYGRNLIETFIIKENEGVNIELQLNSTALKLKSLGMELEEIDKKMCETDCTYCDPDRIDPIYCDDANKYNSYLKEYNKVLDEYNEIVNDYNNLINKSIEPYYQLEKLMFGNIELMERQKNINYDIDFESKVTVLCVEGLYLSIDKKSCCRYPNMYTNENGDCVF